MKARTVQLGEVCDFIRGVTFDKADATIKPEAGKTPILRAGNIGEELDAQNDLVWVTDDHVSEDQLLRQNDIAICMSSGSPDVVGKTARVPMNLRASVGSFCGIIRPKNSDEAGYLSFYFKSPQFRRYRDAIARGANIQNLRFSQFEEIELEIPSEQQRIAGRLEAADGLRRTRRYALELSATFLPAAFLQLFGDPVKNPKGWPIVELLDACDNITDGTHDTPDRVAAGVPFITSKNIRPFEFDFSELDFVLPETHREIIKRCNPRFGDVLYTNIGVNVGNAVANRLNFEFSLKNVALIQPDFAKLDASFLEALLNNAAFKEDILRVSSVGGAQKFVALEILRAVKVVVPPLTLQQQFAGLVARVERLRAVQRESLRQAEHLFQSLLHEAFAA